MLAQAAGNDNPFDMRVYKRGPGTKDKPNMIPSGEPKRIVGCICALANIYLKLSRMHSFIYLNCCGSFTGEEDATSVQWMWLHEGEMKRCQCGYWFKLFQAEMLST